MRLSQRLRDERAFVERTLGRQVICQRCGVTLETIGQPAEGEKTGYTVVCWMEENNVWPVDGVRVHSMNPAGAQRMLDVICRYCDGYRVRL